MAGKQEFKVVLSFEDLATGKLKRASNEQINSMKKVGVQIKKTGTGAQKDLKKMTHGHDEAGRHARTHGYMITELQGKIGALRNIMLLYFFAMRPIMKLYKETTEAAIAQENAEMKLAAAFAATGKGSIAGKKAIIEYSDKLQDLTGFSNDQIIASAALLANYKLSESQVKKVLPVMLDMTAALKASGSASVNTEAIAKRLGLAFTGQASYLKRYGITIDETTAKYGSFDEILKAIESSVKGTAEAMAQTFEGQRTVLSQTTADYKKQFGYIITKAPLVRASLMMVGAVIKKNTKDMEASRKATDNFALTWDRIAAAVIGVTVSIRLFWRYFLQGARALTVVILTVIGWITDLGKAINKLFPKDVKDEIKGLKEGLIALVPGSKKVIDGFIAMGDSINQFGEDSKGAAQLIVDEIDKASKDVKHPIDDMINMYAELTGIASETAKKMAAEIKGLFENANTDMKPAFDGMLEFMTSFATKMSSSMSDGFFKVMKGDFEGLKDTVVSFGNTMLKTITDIIAKLILMKIWKSAAGFLGFAPIASHTGGYIMSGEDSFGAGIRKKFHNGGEVQATLLEGEGVVNRGGMASLGVDNLNKLNRGESMGGGGTVNNYYINTIDERSFRERLQQNGDIYTNASNQNIKDNGPLRQTSQRWG